MNIPLAFNIVYTTFITTASFYIFQSGVLSGVVAVASFLALAFFQGAAILNKDYDSSAEEKA